VEMEELIEIEGLGGGGGVVHWLAPGSRERSGRLLYL